MYRDRRKNIRRVMEVSEIISEYGGGNASARANVLYRWNARNDEMRKENDSMKLYEKFQLYLGMTEEEIEDEIAEKKEILEWMVEHDVDEVTPIGKIIAEYYQDRDMVLDHVQDGDDPDTLL
jgi:molybdopterin synthase catalytic subunit